MRSKEVEEAINNLNFIVVTDIYDNEVSIDKTKVINEYNQSLGIALDYIRKLEEKIEECTDTGAKIISTAYIKNNFIHKDKIREKKQWYKETIKHLGNDGAELDMKEIYEHKIDLCDELLGG